MCTQSPSDDPCYDHVSSIVDAPGMPMQNYHHPPAQVGTMQMEAGRQYSQPHPHVEGDISVLRA
jgi:hypothetical protein